MPNRNNTAEGKAGKTPGDASSGGRNSRSLTPKDVAPPNATVQDRVARKLAPGDADDADEREEEMLDDAVEMTFPASDPIAVHPSDRSHGKHKADRNSA
jgi:hypothetical protein